jgi:hypothetical protein
MDVTVNISDEFAERLIPAGSDASRVMLERLVDEAFGDGRIDAEQKDQILGGSLGAEAKVNSMELDNLQPFYDRYLDGKISDWIIDDPEQVRLHAQIEKFIDALDALELPNSENTGLSVSKSLNEQYAIERKVG